MSWLSDCGFEKLELLVHPMTSVPAIDEIRQRQGSNTTLVRGEKPPWSGKPWFRHFTQISTTLVMCGVLKSDRSGVRDMGTSYTDSSCGMVASMSFVVAQLRVLNPVTV